jgi:VPDSG-CTERM motif
MLLADLIKKSRRRGRLFEETFAKTKGTTAMKKLILLVLFSASFISARINGQTFTYNNDFPNDLIGTASRPESAGKIEIESADDFLITSTPTRITGATFTGLIPANATINDVQVEIYRVFPNDSDTARTPNVVTRANSPSDVAFADRSSNDGNLSFSTSVLSANFTALNSVLNGINKFPNQTTGGEGAVTGQEVRFSIDFLTPFTLPADHYFFIPQVELAGSTDNFFWLSSERPIVSGTPFVPDLQSWIRNANLDPDWSRIGTDIVGGNPAPTFNGSFSLTGTVPDTGSTGALFGAGVVALIWLKRRAA